MSRALQALEAAELAPPTEATLQELIALHPPQFVPTDCPRQAAVDEGVAAAWRKHGWKKLDFKKFKEAAISMPRAATTWVTTGMLRALARVKVGLGKMHWMAEQILNATAPRDVWPLLHEGKLVGLPTSSPAMARASK